MTEESKVNWPPKKYSTPTPHGVSGYKTTGTGGGAYNESNSSSRLPTTTVPAFSGFSRQKHPMTPVQLGSDFNQEVYVTPSTIFEPSFSANYEEDNYGIASYQYVPPRDAFTAAELATYRFVPETRVVENPILGPHRNIEQTVTPQARVGSLGDENGTYNISYSPVYIGGPNRLEFDGTESVGSEWSDFSLEDSVYTNMYFPNTVPVMNTSHTGSGVHPGHATFVQSGHQNVSSTKTPTQAYKMKNQYVDPVLSSMPPPPIPTLPLTKNPTPRLVTSQGIPLRYTVPVVQPMQS